MWQWSHTQGFPEVSGNQFFIGNQVIVGLTPRGFSEVLGNKVIIGYTPRGFMKYVSGNQ